MAPRLATLLLVLTLLAPAAWRSRVSPPAHPACAPEGRGRPPRHWLGCAADPGAARALADEERLLLGRPLDPNRAGARALAFVPGLSRGLARALVEEREARGPFRSVEELRRVEGIGARRLDLARDRLEVSPSPWREEGDPR